MIFDNVLDVYNQIVQRHLGNDYCLTDYDVLINKTDYAVVRLTLDKPPYRLILKLAGPNAPIASPFDRTYAINKRVLNQTTVPTFEALAVDMSISFVPYRYLLMTHIDGQLWSDVRHELHVDDKSNVYRHLGHAIAQLHTIEYSGFGEVCGVEEINSNLESNYLTALSNRAKRRIRNQNHQQLFISLLQENKELFKDAVKPRLTHEDLNPGNIIVRLKNGQWELAAIIDFDSAWAGGCESDLARLELWRGMMGEGFFEEYQKINPISKDYSQRRLFFQLLWCLEYADPSTEHHIDTKDICDKLGIPVVTFV